MELNAAEMIGGVSGVGFRTVIKKNKVADSKPIQQLGKYQISSRIHIAWGSILLARQQTNKTGRSSTGRKK